MHWSIGHDHDLKEVIQALFSKHNSKKKSTYKWKILKNQKQYSENFNGMHSFFSHRIDSIIYLYVIIQFQ